MNEIPESWAAMALGDAVINITITDKKIPQKEYLSEGSYPVFDQGQDYIGGYTDKKEKLVDCKLPVIVFGDHTRAVKFVNRPFAPGADGVKVLQPHRFFNPKLLEFFTRHVTTHLTNYGYARHYQHLVKSIIPLPPVNEQHRIVAKIEELFSELDKGIENLKTARAQLKVYRQALLKHAFEGKLTAQWRAENQDKLETADALLKRIQQERAQRYQQQLADWENKSPSAPSQALPLLQRGKTSGSVASSTPPLKKGGRGDLKPKAPKPLPPLTAEELAELPELPKGWGWMKVDDACSHIVDCLHSTAKFKATGYPCIDTTCIEGMKIVWEKVRFVDGQTFAERISRLKPVLGDILFAREGTVGTTVCVPDGIDLCLGQRMMRRAQKPSATFFGENVAWEKYTSS